MKKTFLFLVLFSIIYFSGSNSYAQFEKYGYKLGVQGAVLLPFTEFNLSDGFEFSYLGRFYTRFELSRRFAAEVGAGYGMVAGKDYNKVKWSSTMIPVDFRLLFKFSTSKAWSPYFYIGAGGLYFEVQDKPSVPSGQATEESAFTGLFPAGFGIEFPLSEQWAFDINGGYNISLNDNLNYYQYNVASLPDGWYHVGFGFSFAPDDSNTDKDGDGIIKKDEVALGTDPNNPDTDGDGLNDGEEILTYKTDPLSPDSDGDELNDFEEINVYKTDPNMKDSDGDALNDGAEVKTFGTNPLRPDTDGDKLKDGDEVNNFKTDPLKTDTDMDKLFDGEEVLKYETNPLKADTDGGTVPDGVEVKRGTNPLDPDDDVVKAPPPPKVEYIEGVLFDFDKSNIDNDADMILKKAAIILKKFGSINVEIQGHTDSIGPETYNQKLSERRAKAVQDWLVKNGVSADQLSTKGFGELKPVAPNNTKEGRHKNRRAEFNILDK